MNIFDDFTRKVLVELNEAGVIYLIVGGYAVNFHGFRRTTGDIDIWLKPENEENKKRLMIVFTKLGCTPEFLNEVEQLDFSQPLLISDGEEPYKIDFLTSISGVKFEDAWKERQTTEIEGILLHFIHYNHLILSKITSSRLKDKMDIETLQRIRKIKNEGEEKNKDDNK